VLAEIRDQVAKRPKVGRIRFVFEKAAVNEWERQLIAAKADLLLAHQIFGR